MKMLHKKMTIITILFLFLITGSLWAQLPEFNIRQDEDVPNFYYDVMTLAGPDARKSMLRLFTKIAFDELQFIQGEELYRAEYELYVTVLNEAGDEADSRVVKKEALVDTYERTNSHLDFSLAQTEFFLSPGTYDLIIGIMDMDARKTGRRKTQVIIPDYHVADMDISDMLMVDYVVVDSTGSLITSPNVLSNYSDTQETMSLVYEIYNRGPKDSVKVSFRITDFKNKERRKREYFKTLTGERTVDIIEVPRGDLKSGRYKLALTIGDGDEAITRNRDFSIRWIGMPTFTADLDKAVEQMKHIAKGSYIKKMKKAKREERLILFRDFWKNLDPTPGTSENELMEEYYNRVAYANANFATFQEGWKSDRGMVYIILGPPDDINRRPFDMGSRPNEHWYYYEMNRVFIFVDKTGLGEYRLITPFWDVLNRMP